MCECESDPWVRSESTDISTILQFRETETRYLQFYIIESTIFQRLLCISRDKSCLLILMMIRLLIHAMEEWKLETMHWNYIYIFYYSRCHHPELQGECLKVAIAQHFAFWFSAKMYLDIYLMIFLCTACSEWLSLIKHSTIQIK